MTRDRDHVLETAARVYDSLRGAVGGPASTPALAAEAGAHLANTSEALRAALIQLACADVYAVLHERRDDWRIQLANAVIDEALRRPVTLTSTRLSAVLIDTRALSHNYAKLLPMVRLVQLVPCPPSPEDAASLRAFLASFFFKGGLKPLIRAITRVLDGDSDDAPAPGGPWSRRVFTDLADCPPATAAAWRRLLVHVRHIGASEPSTRWTRDLRKHLDRVGREDVLARILRWMALGPTPDERPSTQMPERDADYLLGLVWTLAEFDSSSVARPLADMAEQCLKKVPGQGAVSERAGHACIRVLALLGGFNAISQLGRLQARVRYRASQTLLARHLDEAARNAGLSREELEEIAVPTFDLDACGSLRCEIDDYTAEIRIVGSDEVALSWREGSGAPRKTVPDSVRTRYAEQLAHLKKTSKDIASLLPGQRVRLERLLVSGRHMGITDWRARYAEHPLVGEMSRRLVWQFVDGDRRSLGILCDDRIVDAEDRPLDWLSPAAQVASWHPLGAAPTLVQAWRVWLERHQVTQPFKQAHRETYGLVDSERRTGAYSNRFAGHILRQHQFAILCRERGWRYSLQGDWDSHNTPAKALERWGLSVAFWVDRTDDCAVGPSGVFPYVGTDRVEFHRGRDPVPLEAVPPLAFSEAMRDVDLFVSVCSIGMDPGWSDRGPTPHLDYCHAFATATLAGTAETRREVLERLVPTLSIANRLTLDERYLVVRGDLATYRIHIGSGNVFIEPGSRHLSMPRSREIGRMRGGPAWLPFEGDATLALVLHYALVLAFDRRITDRAILTQIRQDRPS